jgi:hypothetical protein
MKTYGGMQGYLQSFLISVLDVGEWSPSRPGRFTPRSYWVGCRVGPSAGLDSVERIEWRPLPGIEPFIIIAQDSNLLSQENNDRDITSDLVPPSR